MRARFDAGKRVTAVTVWTDRCKINHLIFEQEDTEIELRQDYRRNMHAEPRKVNVPAGLNIIGFYGMMERDLITKLGLLLWNPETKSFF